MKSFVLAYGILYAGGAIYFGYISEMNSGYLLAGVIGFATAAALQQCDHYLQIRNRCRRFLRRTALTPSAS